MCHLSTTIDPEHEPLLWLGVVNLWQPKSGTWCRAYGWWTGPFSHHCDGKLLQNIASHPVVEWHHQLAYVSHLLADTKGHTEIDFFLQKNSSTHTTFHRQLTGWHQAVHDAITHFTSTYHHVLEEDSAQIPSWDTVLCDTAIHSVPRGNVKHKRTSQGRRGRTKPILRRTGCLTREATSEPFMLALRICTVNVLWCQRQNFYSARGTELLWYQGHRTFIVLGAQDFLKVPGA